MARFFFIGASGPDDPTRACLPFHLAVNTVHADIEAELFLTGDAVVLVRDTVIDTLTPVGFRPLRDLMRSMVDLAVPIFL